MNDNEKFDRINALNAELAQLMSNLSANTSSIGDWKIIKIYEARMESQEDPYDFDSLAAARQATRVRINEIQKELETVGIIEDVQVAGFDQVLFIVDGVKVSFYAAPRKRIASMQEIPYMNNIRLADVESIGIMKMEAMMRRSKFRDYYDIYSILKNGADIKTLIPRALEHSGYKMKSKGLMAMLSNGTLFKKDSVLK